MHIKINNNIETLIQLSEVDTFIDHAMKLYTLEDTQRVNIKMVLEQEKEALAIFNGNSSPARCIRVESDLVTKYSKLSPNVVYAAIEVTYDSNK